MNGMHYSHRTESGVLFHMIGALSEFGKVGLTVIGNDDDEVAGIYDKAIEVLDLEASMGHESVRPLLADRRLSGVTGQGRTQQRRAELQFGRAEAGASGRSCNTRARSSAAWTWRQIFSGPTRSAKPD